MEGALFATDDDDVDTDSSVVELPGGPVLPASIDPSVLEEVASIAAIRCCAVRNSRTCFALDAFTASKSGAPPVLVNSGLSL